MEAEAEAESIRVRTAHFLPPFFPTVNFLVNFPSYNVAFFSLLLHVTTAIVTFICSVCCHADKG